MKFLSHTVGLHTHRIDSFFFERCVESVNHRAANVTTQEQRAHRGVYACYRKLTEQLTLIETHPI
jgi:hypothetical protein